MNNKEIWKYFFNSLVEFSPTRLVECAENGHGFVGDDGAYGVWYPDEPDLGSEGQNMVEVGYWEDGIKYIKVPLHEYLNALKEFLISKGEIALKERVDKIII